MNLDRVRALVAELASEVAADVPVATTVKAGQSLQAALFDAGTVVLESGAIFEGSFTVGSDTTLIGQPGSGLAGKTGPALLIQPGTQRVTLSSFSAVSDSPHDVISIGLNTSAQTRVEDAPAFITANQVRVPTHRGKRGFGIHARDWVLKDCEVLDCYSSRGDDSQGVYVGNSPGRMRIDGGRYVAGSSPILFGGDVTQIPGLVPDGAEISNVDLCRPLSWQTDGVARKVKNLWEVKNGRNIHFHHSKLHGCWANGQQGEAIVLTPALDGSIKTPPLRSGIVENIVIEDVDVYDCGSVFNMLCRHYTSWTDPPLSVTVRRLTSVVSRAKFGGRGQFAQIGGDDGTVIVEDCTHQGDGSSVLYFYAGSVLDPVTRTLRPGTQLQQLRITGSRFPAPVYGMMFNGAANGLNATKYVRQLDVSKNTFSGSVLMKPAFPDNVYE